MYLDHGWQTIVDGLVGVADRADVNIVTEASVQSVRYSEEDYQITFSDGENLTSNAVILATSPDIAAKLVPEAAILRQWADEAVAVVSSTLDVGLKSIPEPKHVFALGIDQPVYFSMHSHYADLAPEDGALIHVARYFDDYRHVDPKETEKELEGVLDLMQPGWRKVCETRRFLPKMTVSNAIAMAQRGGYEGRPSPEVPSMPDLYVIGDWVGNEGMLADASIASAKQAAEMVLSQTKVLV